MKFLTPFFPPKIFVIAHDHSFDNREYYCVCCFFHRAFIAQTLSVAKIYSLSFH
jgi:hypothetical protein